MTSTSQKTLYYVHDPMCSWCWAFKPTWQKVRAEIDNKVNYRYLLGGLAPDNNVPMGLETQNYIQANWEKIQQVVPGTEFNFDFWQVCQPRRSTYPACRAAIIARAHNKEPQMIEAIQHAYYLHAQNPSDESTLITLAEKIGLDKQQFSEELCSEALNQKLHEELAFSASLPIQGFPSLVLITDNKAIAIKINYTDHQQTLNTINALLA